VKVGKHSIVDNSWLSSEFLKVGKNVILGMNSTVITFGIEQDKFFIKKILIEDEVLIGAKCSILPGTHIKRGVKLVAYSYTSFDEMLEEHKLYGGHPAKIIMD
jgi:UDP-3-O-[3-hydroxymyristoyl] glucosamine N-acyltransferase